MPDFRCWTKMTAKEWEYSQKRAQRHLTLTPLSLQSPSARSWCTNPLFCLLTTTAAVPNSSYHCRASSHVNVSRTLPTSATRKSSHDPTNKHALLNFFKNIRSLSRFASVDKNVFLQSDSVERSPGWSGGPRLVVFPQSPNFRRLFGSAPQPWNEDAINLDQRSLQTESLSKKNFETEKQQKDYFHKWSQQFCSH